MCVWYYEEIRVYRVYGMDNTHSGFNKTGFNKWFHDVIDF